MKHRSSNPCPFLDISMSFPLARATSFMSQAQEKNYKRLSSGFRYNEGHFAAGVLFSTTSLSVGGWGRGGEESAIT